MFSLFALPLAIASLASASPLRTRASSSPGCAGLSLAYDNGYNFTLTAVNTTLDNSNSTGVPLTAAYHLATGSSTGSFWSTLTTVNSYPTSSYNYPIMGITSGVLAPIEGSYHVIDMEVWPGEYVQWEFSADESELPSTQPIYCIVEHLGEGSAYSLLAVNGDTGSFSLCEATTALSSGTPNNVVYQAAQGISAYDYSSCYPVEIHVNF